MVEQAGNDRLLLISSNNPNKPRTVDLRFQEYVLPIFPYTVVRGGVGAGLVVGVERVCANRWLQAIQQRISLQRASRTRKYQSRTSHRFLQEEERGSRGRPSQMGGFQTEERPSRAFKGRIDGLLIILYIFLNCKTKFSLETFSYVIRNLLFVRDVFAKVLRRSPSLPKSEDPTTSYILVK